MVKFKERILKAAKEKQLVDIQGSSHKTVSRFLNRNFAGQKGLTQNIQSNENPRHYPAKLSFRIEGQMKSFSDKIITTEPVLQ